MPGYFDDEQLEPEEETRDTEVTLRPSAQLAIFVGLVLLCGLCFGLGYLVGHRIPATSSAAATAPATQTQAPDQEPLESNGSIPKPPAAAQAAVPGSAAASDGAQPSAAGGGEGTNPGNGAAQPSSGQGSGQSSPPPSSAAGAAQPATQPQVRQAMPSTANPPQPVATGATPNVQAALPGAGQLMVQVAAVSHSEDADVLVGALRKRGYAVTARRDPGDGLIHVRVGPFNSRDEANRWRTKLLDDGYNAIIQP